MKMSLKMALATSIIWICFMYVGLPDALDWHGIRGSDWFVVTGFGIAMIWYLCFLFKRHIDKKFD
jgi:hypothetical protein